jgi:VWFA-related protein
LDRSGGSMFCNLIGAAKVKWIRAARSTQTFGAFFDSENCTRYDLSSKAQAICGRNASISSSLAAMQTEKKQISKIIQFIFCGLCCLSSFINSYTQQQSQPTTDSELTRILVTAIDRNGQISRLRLPDINLREDGESKVIADFKIQINAPTSLAVMIDASQSQKRLLPLSKSTARVFVKGFIRPSRDVAAIISFANSVLIRHSLTDDVEILRSSIEKIEAVSPFVIDVSNGKLPDKKKPVGSTALTDAIIFACDKVLDGSVDGTRKAILIFTDGYDSSSSSKTQDAIETAVKKDIAIYAVALPTDEEGSLSLREDQAKLRELSEQTGGRAYFPAKNEQLQSILSQIEQDLRAQYIVTFRSGSTAGRKNNRRLKIEIVSPQKKNEKIQLAYRRRY